VARCNQYNRKDLVPVYVGKGFDLLVGYASTSLASELLLLNQGYKVETKLDSYIRLAPMATDPYQVGRGGVVQRKGHYFDFICGSSSGGSSSSSGSSDSSSGSGGSSNSSSSNSSSSSTSR